MLPFNYYNCNSYIGKNRILVFNDSDNYYYLIEYNANDFKDL